MNDYYDYQMPIEDPTAVGANDIRVLAFRIRQKFSAQNIELNFWRFGTPSTAGCGYSSTYGACTAVPMDSCSGGVCGASTCGPRQPQRRFLVNGLMGVRFFRIDEDFGFDTFFTMDDGAGGVVAGEPPAYTGFPPGEDNTLLHDIEVDNNLVGFQIGGSMNWLIGCKWSVFADSNFGVYGNHIDSYQRVYSMGPGVVRFNGTTGDAVTRDSKDDVAFVGELRTGVAYQVTKRWRASAAYRLLAVSGIAVAQDQLATNAQNVAHFGVIHSDGSLFLQGVQLGAETKF